MDFMLKGYEYLELSTQIIIKEALARGNKVEILDKKLNIIRISNLKKTEIIKQATKTSLDSYISAEILGHKSVCKILLQEKNISVPTGKTYYSYEQAIADYDQYKNQEIIIKPESTNFGLGIVKISPKDNEAFYQKSVKQAFDYDDKIIVENFVKGLEYRFLVIGGKCLAVLHRIPANVVGDGKSTIKQLIAQKNNHIYRGEGHTTPLEKIKLDKIEVDFLNSQNLTENSIIEKNQQIFLRSNSNISTGGDSIDYTDKAHYFYKQIAEQTANYLNSKICGIDIITEDINKAVKSGDYAVIEANYNPVLYIHKFPQEGKDRQVEVPILELLGF